MRGVCKVECCYGVARNAVVSNPVVHEKKVSRFQSGFVVFETLKPCNSATLKLAFSLSVIHINQTNVRRKTKRPDLRPANSVLPRRHSKPACNRKSVVVYRFPVGFFNCFTARQTAGTCRSDHVFLSSSVSPEHAVTCVTTHNEPGKM